MSQFNWWRRHKKKAPLQRKNAIKGKSFLLQQIEHGDYDVSDYGAQAQYEKELCKQEQDNLAKLWKASPESLKERLLQIERKYTKRYNKLMEDFLKDEARLLQTLKEKLILEFKVDCWDEAVQYDTEQDLVQFFKNYKNIANETSKRF